jgi:hypothetical protein
MVAKTDHPARDQVTINTEEKLSLSSSDFPGPMEAARRSPHKPAKVSAATDRADTPMCDG